MGTLIYSVKGGEKMRVCFVGQEEVAQFRKLRESQKADVILFGFNGLGEVNYEKELKGETAFFEEAALLSKEQKSLVVCGCITNTCGHKRKSALIAENGRLCGVSDMLHTMDGEWGSGASLRVYDTKVGKVGVAVAEDVYYPEVIKTLVACGSDFILCPFSKVINSVPSVLLRAYSYCYGVPILLCGEGYSMYADGTGELAFASPQSPSYAEFDKVKEYHLVQTRKRGRRFTP